MTIRLLLVAREVYGAVNLRLAEADYTRALYLAGLKRDEQLARLDSLKQFVAETTEKIKAARGAAKRKRGPPPAPPRRGRRRARGRPNAHYCPITRGVMGGPVFAQGGNTYERAAIEEWFRTKKTSPMTNEPMRFTGLVPARGVKELIEAWGSL